MAMARYNIGQLAKAAELPTTTVRFYERKRLIAPVGRTLGNYRWYDQSSIERLRFIKLAHSGGFSLSDIKVLLESFDGSSAQCNRVAELIKCRLNKVKLQIKELKRLEKVLAMDLRLCQAGRPQRCAVVDQLRTAVKKSAGEIAGSAGRRPENHGHRIID
jgi:MerR family mercuric resistance operon transcriptional regulator